METLIYPNERKAVLRKSCSRKDKTVNCSKLTSLDFDNNGHHYNTSDIQHVEIPMKYQCLEEIERVEFLYNARANCHIKSSFTVLDSFIAILTCPMFYVTAVTNVSFYFLYHMYVVVIVDYALDRSVPEDNTKYIIFAFSVSDLFGRLCLGWITDRQFLRRSHFVMGCMAIIGLVFFCFPFANSYWSLIAASCCYGLLLGTTMVVFPILLVDFLGTELHAVAYGCMCFMNGIASFARPFLIGYFRDTLGSYRNMFFVLGIISVTASSLWLLEKCFIRQNDSKENNT
ncbi:Monocarboxylate transporter 12, partial [Stegodyphus mimosarum]